MKPRIIDAVEMGSAHIAISEAEDALTRLNGKLQNGRGIEGENIPALLATAGDLMRLASIASDTANKLLLRIGYVNNAAEMAKLRAERAKAGEASQQ